MKYKVYYIDHKGILEEAKDRWGENAYSTYDSVEEAIAAIREKRAYGPYTVLPVIEFGYWDYEEDK